MCIPHPYKRKAHYYETDQMGIVHHSNYIRWFEETRVDFMEQLGFGYGRMEQEGISSPVLFASCEYKSMVYFGDEVAVDIRLAAFTGSRMTILYRVENLSTGKPCAFGETRHCFLNRAGRPVSLKKEHPEACRIFKEWQRETGPDFTI